MNEGDPGVGRQGPDQGGSVAEREVLQVQYADLCWIDRGNQGLAQSCDVATEDGALQALSGHRQQVEPGGSWGLGMAGASMKARAGMRGLSPV